MGWFGLTARLGVLGALAACGFDVAASSGVDAGGDGALPPDAPRPAVCEANQCRLRFDTAGELAASAAAIDIAVEPDLATPADPARAVLTPAAYLRGAALARGSAARHLVGEAIDWAAIEAATASGVSFGPPDLALGAGALIPVGLTGTADYTYWFEGEIELPAGITQLELRADDVGELQIAPPNTRAFASVTTATYQAAGTAMFDAGAGGWFPFRAAMVQRGGDRELRILAAIGGGSPVAIPRARLRSRVDGMQGAFVVAWDDRNLAGPATPSLYTRALLDDEIAGGLRAPGLTGDDDLTQRWFGQYRASAAGAHTLAITSDDGARIYLGDQLVDHLADSGPTISTSIAATLRAGWNDLVIDYNEFGGGEYIDLVLASAPTGIATGGTIPLAQLRPVLPRRASFVTFHDTTSRAIPNNTNTGVDITFTPSVLPGETVREVRVAHVIQHGMIGEVDVDLIHDGVTASLRNSSTTASRWYTPTEFAGRPLAGAWTLHVDDESGSQTGNLTSWSITVLTDGGPGQIADRAEWVSTVQDLGTLGTVTAFGALDAGLTLPAGAGAQLYVRTGADPAACAAATWVGPIAVGAPVPATIARYAQLRAVLTSNGADEPTLDFLELPYTVAPN